MFLVNCENCKGSGKDTDFNRKLVKCEECNGTGVLLTREGRELKEFFDKIIKPTLEKKEKEIKKDGK